MLQLGGVQEAVTDPAPGIGVVTEQVVPDEQDEGADTAAGSDELHVSEGLGAMQPWTSTAVAARDSVVPLVVAKLV